MYNLLRSKQDGRVYTGFTSNLKRRFAEHINGLNHSTKRMGEIELIFYEAFLNKEDAKRREKYFKTTKGKRAVKLMLAKTLGPIV